MPKVLLVEDDNNLRDIFQMRLQAEGYSTLAAADGEEGLVIALKEKPDLIIADIMMPKLSGFEMVENIRSSPELKGSKVIMMTALGQAEDQARGEKLAVIKYLVKSQVTLEDFARVVKEVLGPGNPEDVAAKQVVDNTTNSQESENPMQEDPATNPTPTPGTVPASDPAAPATDPAAPATDGQQSVADEQQVVDQQVNNFTGSTPDTPAPAGGDQPMPAGDTGASTDTGAPTMPPASEPPVAPTEPPASTDENQPGSTPPTDPTSNAL